MTNRTLNRWLTSFTPSARKPVAISCSSRSRVGVAAGSRSPAICSRTNWSYGLSRVERVDDVVAIPPGVRVGDVPRRAGRLAVAGDVEPVPAPALAERRRREQPIDDLLERVGRGVRRRTRRPPPASAAGRSGRTSPGGSASRRSASPTGVRPFCFELGQDEAVDVVARPRGVAHRRAASASRSGCQAQCSFRSFSYFGVRLADARPATSTSGQAAPSLIHVRQVGDLLGRQLLLRRHLQVVVRRAGRPGSAGSSPARPARPPGRGCRPGAGHCGRRRAGRPWRWCWPSGSCSSCRPGAAGPSSRRTRPPRRRRRGRPLRAARSRRRASPRARIASARGS